MSPNLVELVPPVARRTGEGGRGERLALHVPPAGHSRGGRGEGSGGLAVDRIRVLVADDDPDLRDSLIDLIGWEASLDRVGVAEDAGEAIELAERHQPDVALVDVRMPPRRWG